MTKTKYEKNKRKRNTIWYSSTYTFFFIRKIFIRKWAAKTLKPSENVKKISSRICLNCSFHKHWLLLELFKSYKIEEQSYKVLTLFLI